MEIALYTKRLSMVAAFILILTGMLLYLFPREFPPALYGPLLDLIPLLSPGLTGAGVFVLISLRHPFPKWVGRLLPLFPAALLTVLAHAVGQMGGYTGTALYLALALALLLAPWFPEQRATAHNSPDLLAATLAVVEIAVGLLLLLLPDHMSTIAFRAIRPYSPFIGLAGLLGGASLLLPDAGGVWALPIPLTRRLAASILPLALTYTFLASGAWTGTQWLVVATGLLAFRVRLPQRAGAVPEESIGNPVGLLHRIDQMMELRLWSLAVLLLTLSSLPEIGLGLDPGRTNPLVVAICAYVVIVYWLMEDRGRPAIRVLSHLLFQVVAVGWILPEGSPVSQGFLMLLAVLPILAARALGRRAGLCVLLAAVGAVLWGGVADLLLQGRSIWVLFAQSGPQVLLLGAVASSGFAWAEEQRRTLLHLGSTRDELQRQVKQLALLDRIGRAVRGSLGIDETLQTTAQELGMVINVDRCFFQLTDGNGFRPVTHQYLRAGVAPPVCGPCPCAERAARLRTTVAVRSPAELEIPETGPPLQRLDSDWMACLAVPLETNGELMGVLVFHDLGVARAWSPDEIALVESVAGQVTVAMAHARDHEEILQRHRELQEAHLALQVRDLDVHESDQRFSGAFREAPIGMSLTRYDMTYIQVNQALCDMLGYTESELLSRSITEVTHPDDVPETIRRKAALARGECGRTSWEKRYIHRNGQHVWCMVSASQIRAADGSPSYFIAHVQDITERKRAEEQLLEMANYDSLTGLCNRRRFHEELEKELASARRYGQQGALIFLDLDQFKYLNDSLGHQAGDELLRDLGQVLKGRLRRTDSLARLGGDEFGILLTHVQEGQALQIADSLLHAVREHVQRYEGESVQMTASLGIATFPDQAATVEELLSKADMAMYQAKEDGRNTYAVYSTEHTRTARMGSRLTWERRIRDALQQNRFVLHAQPILNLSTGNTTQYELLLRMIGEEGEIIPPSAFLEVAERFGLIQEIDRWVVGQAIHLLADWNRQGQEISLEVNLSGKAFSDPELLPLIRRELAATGINPYWLVLEITETAAIADTLLAKQFVETLREIGCRFALDDFGSGFSSFYYLKHLPVDYLKIDGSFIKNLPSDPVDQQLVRTLVEMARNLGKQTIAEFVTDEATVQILQQMGVDFAQGFHVGQPGIFSELMPPQSRPKVS